MIIKKIQIFHNKEIGTYIFDAKGVIINSEFNASGKTSLARVLAWSLGYKNQSLTDKINSKKLKTIITINIKNKDIIITRTNNIVKVDTKKEKKTYFFPHDFENFIKYVYGVSSLKFSLLSFGSIIDQDNGWKVINRGKINFNSIYFDLRIHIPMLISDNKIFDDLEHLIVNKSTLLKKLNQMENFINIYNKNSFIFNEIDDSKQNAVLNVLSHKLEKINLDIMNLKNEVNRKNEVKKIFANNNISILYKKEIIKITQDKIISSSNDSQINIFEELKDWKEDDDLDKIKFVSGRITKINYLLKNNIKEIEEKISNILSKDSLIISDFIKEISEYTEIIKVDPKKILSTAKWKGLSGARRMILVMAIRMSYNKLIEKYLGFNIPMIIDSPAANEFDDKSLEIVNSILNKINSQKIIFTIEKKIKVKGLKSEKIKEKFLKDIQMSIEE